MTGTLSKKSLIFCSSGHRITLGNKIGEGAFGRVMKGYTHALRGTIHPTPVAVKMLKEDAGEQELEDLIKVNTI